MNKNAGTIIVSGTSSVPTIVGIIGLCLYVAAIAVQESRGGDASMSLSVILLVGGSLLPLVLITGAFLTAKRDDKLSCLWGPGCIAVLLLLLTWGIVYPSHTAAMEGMASTQEIVGFNSALRRYVEDHDGNFPGNLDALVTGAYIRKTDEGTWLVPEPNGDGDAALRNPEWFDVAWGIHIRELNAGGMVIGKSRPIVRPAASASAGRCFDSVCLTISELLGERFGRHRGDQE